MTITPSKPVPDTIELFPAFLSSTKNEPGQIDKKIDTLVTTVLITTPETMEVEVPKEPQERCVDKLRSARREVSEPGEKKTLKANRALLESTIFEQMSLERKRKGKEAATPSPIKKIKVNSPPTSPSLLEQRSHRVTNLSRVKRRLVFESSSSSTTDLDDLFRDFHNLQ